MVLIPSKEKTFKAAAILKKKNVVWCCCMSLGPLWKSMQHYTDTVVAGWQKWSPKTLKMKEVWTGLKHKPPKQNDTVLDESSWELDWNNHVPNWLTFPCMDSPKHIWFYYLLLRILLLKASNHEQKVFHVLGIKQNPKAPYHFKYMFNIAKFNSNRLSY